MTINDVIAEYERIKNPRILFAGMSLEDFESWLKMFPNEDTSGLLAALLSEEMYEFANVVKKINTST